MRDEGELIRAASRGDRAAFDRLVDLKRDRVARVAYQITGDFEDALDVAQTVFLKLWGGLDRYDAQQRFDTWLYRVTVNAAIDLLRSRGPRGWVRPFQEGEAESHPAAETSTPGVLHAEEALDLATLQRVFQRLARELGPRQRAAFVLHEIEGLSTAETARVLNVTESTIRNHLLQARRTLRVRLEHDYPEWVPRGGRAAESRGAVRSAVPPGDAEESA